MKAKIEALKVLISIVIIGVVGHGVSGCSTIHPAPSAERGLFQKNESNAVGSQVGSDLPVVPLVQDHGFIWPLKTGVISSGFGDRRRNYHDGIDIRAKRGTPVYAAQAGEVIYSSRRIKGYGNMMVIRHNNSTATVYAHCRKNLVKRGDWVEQGEMVGYVGATGRATGPHLHFEIRQKELPQDPLQFLPANEKVVVEARVRKSIDLKNKIRN